MEHDDLNAKAVVRRWLRAFAGLAVGAAYAVVEVGLLLVRVPLGRRLDRQVDRLVARELRRIDRYHGPVPVAAVREPTRSLRYLSVRWLVGGLGFGVLLLVLLCLAVAGSMITAWAFDGGWGLVQNDGGVDTGLVLVAGLPGVLLMFVAAAGVLGVGTLDRWLATELLGGREDLRQRVAELTTVVEAITEERRRIERDLHDGVQQRMVALGVLIGRARRACVDERVHSLLTQAATVSQETMGELREVAQRVYPSALDEGGLAVALEALAQRTSVPVRVSVSFGALASSLETVAYFVASEAVTNAVKHASPGLVEVSVRQGDALVVTVTDDGCGGADHSGTGLSGLARRVAAVSGVFTVDSPVGGPTVVRAELPCG